MTDALDRVLAEDYMAGLTELPLDEVRARRSECQEIEVGLSFARRIVQGRLDIIHAESERRASGAARSSSSELVDRLEKGEMLGDHARPAGFGRLPTLMTPGPESEAFLAEADELAASEALVDLPSLSDEDLSSLGDKLGDLERRLSDRRRQVFDRIDAIQAEIVRRYKSGAASPDSLLKG